LQGGEIAKRWSEHSSGFSVILLTADLHPIWAEPPTFSTKIRSKYSEAPWGTVAERNA
jgi:hypothetical protein